MRARFSNLRQHRLIGRLFDWRVLAGIVVLGVIALAGGLFVVGKAEENNQFCGACHTEPETTYLTRFDAALAGQPADDLAAFHHKQLYPRNSQQARNIRCIDCHVGEGIIGRGIVVSLAAWDALKYVTRTARQPAVVVFTIQNEACLKCHAEQAKKNLDLTRTRFEIDNHYHYKLFEPNAPFERCVDCHLSHEPGTELNAFQFRKVIIPVCEDCHKQEGKGPIKMQ